MTEAQAAIAANLKRLRADRNLTQAALGEMASVTATTVVHAETGRTWLRPQLITAFARALGVPEVELFRDDTRVAEPPLPVAVEILNRALEDYVRLTRGVPRDILDGLLDQDEYGFAKVRAVLTGGRVSRDNGDQSVKISVEPRKHRGK